MDNTSTPSGPTFEGTNHSQPSETPLSKIYELLRVTEADLCQADMPDSAEQIRQLTAASQHLQNCGSNLDIDTFLLKNNLNVLSYRMVSGSSE